MRASRLGWGALFLAAGAVVTAGVVSAGAPPGQYQSFNADNTAIVDSKTGLRWERRPRSEKVSLQAAETYCRENAPDAGGSGWRLPTVKELMTLVDEQSVPVLENGVLVYHAIDGNAFPNTPADLFWSSTLVGSGPDVWGIRFDTGEMTPLPTGSTAINFVRCVR